MKLFIGLGNPGNKYKNTRHNVGWMVLDRLVSSFQFPIESQLPSFKFEKSFNAEVLKMQDVLLVKPQTFMNESGKAVKKLVDFYKVDMDDLYVIHDDLDIKLGEYKIQKGVGPKVHGGVNSIENELGKEDFWRVRIGIDNRDSENKISGEEYVLMEFSEGERVILQEVIQDIVQKFPL